MNMRLFSLILAAILLFGIFIDVVDPVYGFMGRVPTSHVGIITTFGKMSDETLEPGFHIKGFFDKVASVDTRTQKYTVDILAFSSDIQQVNLTANLNFNVDKKNAPILYREIGTNYLNSLIDPRFQENVKIVVSRYTAEELVTLRSQVALEIQDTLTEKMEPYGIVIEKFNIVNFSFSEEFAKAIEAKEVAAQNLLKAKTEQEQVLVEANAQAEKKVIAAEAEAKAILAKAEAQAKANETLSKSLNGNVIKYYTVDKWDGKMPKATGGNALIDFSAEEE